MKNDIPFIEVRPVKPDEKKNADICIDISFSNNKEKITHQGFFRQMNYLPLRKPEFQWAVFVNNEPVAGLMLIPYHIQIGLTTFHMVGLTGVGTHPDHRHKGYSSKLLKAVHNYLKNEGYHGAVLHSGADELYLKNGYEPCFGAMKGIILQSQFDKLIENSTSLITVEFLMANEISEEIYKILWHIRNTDPIFCSRGVKIVRGYVYFATKLKELLEKGYIIAILKNKDQIIGYGTAQLGKSLTIIEQYFIYPSSEIRSQIIIQFWITLINEFEPYPDSLEINLFAEDQTTRSLIENYQGNVNWSYMTGNMALFFDPLQVFNLLQTTFCMRLEDSAYMNIVGTFRFHISVENGQKHIDMHISHGEVTVIPVLDEKSLGQSSYPLLWEGSLTSREFTLIIFGFENIMDILDENLMKFEDKSDAILPILFPKQYPIWDYGDQY